jgi:hypothetical protein
MIKQATFVLLVRGAIQPEIETPYIVEPLDR